MNIDYSRGRSVFAIITVSLFFLGYPNLMLRAQDISTLQKAFDQAKAARSKLYPFCEQVQRAANNKHPILVTKDEKAHLVTSYKKYGDVTFNKAIAIATEQLHTCKNILALEQQLLKAQLNKKPEFDVAAKLIWNSDSSQIETSVGPETSPTVGWTGNLTGNENGWTFKVESDPSKGGDAIGQATYHHNSSVVIRPTLLKCTGSANQATCDAVWQDQGQQNEWHCAGSGDHSSWWFIMHARECKGFIRNNGKVVDHPGSAQYEFGDTYIIANTK